MSDNAIAKPNAEIGKAILEAAKANFDAKRREKVLAQVEDIHRSLADVSETERVCTERRKIFEGRLAALEAGDFEFNSRTGLVTYNDKTLESVG